MDSNDESSSMLIEEILLTSGDEEEILIDSDSTNDSPEMCRSKPSKREIRKYDLSDELFSKNSSDSDNFIASESNFIIPHSDSDSNNELTLEQEKSNSSNNEITEISTINFIKVNDSVKLDENNNLNDSLFSASTPSSINSRLFSRFNDSKLFQPCSVLLQRITDNTIQSFKPSNKRKYEMTYNKQSDEESNWSNGSNWSTGRKKKVKKQHRSSSSVNGSISTSSVSSLKPKKTNCTSKKTSQTKKLKEKIVEQMETKSSDFFNEDTNLGFENSNYTCQISNNERIKLKISKSNVQKESKIVNEETSNQTIFLSSRSNSPSNRESTLSKVTETPIPEIKTPTVASNESCATVTKKNDGLLKTTLKKQNEKVNLLKKSKTNSLANLDSLQKNKEKSFSIKKSIIEKISDTAIDRSYKIPKLNRKEETNNDLSAKPKSKAKETNGKNAKKNTKKKFHKKETRKTEKKNFLLKNKNVEYTKINNKNRQKIELMTRDQIPKLRDLHKKRNEFNHSIGAKYPFFSLLYMFEDYVKKMSTVACLDFDLLMSNSPVDDSELSISRLNRDEQIQLCRLMSRSAGRVNPFELINMDPMLREFPENYNFSIPNPIDSDKEDDYFLNLMDELTMSEAYILYKRFISRLNSPYRSIELVRIANTDGHTLFVTFENDFEIENLDLSIESVVQASLHK